MKQEHIVLPPAKKCVVCETQTDKPYARTTYGDTLCSKVCNKKWQALDWRDRYTLHRSRK